MRHGEEIDRDQDASVTRLAEEMQAVGHRRHDPVREILSMVGDKWTTLILLILEMGTWRHADLRRAVGRLGEDDKISQRMMTLKLKALEREGLVIRSATAQTPPKVSYRLSDTGQSLTAEVRRLISWVEIHQLRIREDRRRFDDANETAGG